MPILPVRAASALMTPVGGLLAALIAATATFALNAGPWLRRGRLAI